jgi:sugar phosphate isomerase/epimerase
MIRSAITVSLVPEAHGGPFVYWNGLQDAFARASKLGFQGIEIFPPDADAIDPDETAALCKVHGMSIAAVGTGAGWVKHKLHLCHPDLEIRVRARAFIGKIIARAARLGAPAILGSMQGRVEHGIERAQALDWLAEALVEAGKTASALGTHFLYEPLNRYETNLINRQNDAATFIQSRDIRGVKILADLFHMNIEEDDLCGALRSLATKRLLGHVHFADSNRRAVGMGHMDAGAIAVLLREMAYDGYLSAEILPLPDSDQAATYTITSFREWFA